MRMIYLLVVGSLIGLSIPALSQTQKTSSKSAPPKQETLAQATDSLNKSVRDIKTSFGKLFGGKTDTTSIQISGIDYDDVNLSHLRENLKELREVRSIVMQYNSGNATIKVAFKGRASSTDLWDNLSPVTKQPFKLINASDNNLTLEYKK
jgi:hypothetical protein